MKVPKPHQLPSGTWFIQLRLGGESITVTAPDTKTGKSECSTKAELIKAEYRAGKRQIQKQTSNPTLTQAIDNYIAARNNALSPATIRGYRVIQRNRFSAVQNNKLSEITDWQKICNAEAKKLSAKTVLNSWGLIESVLRDNGLSVPKVTLPQVVKKERPWLTPEQITAFVKAAKGQPCEIAALLELHSLRRSELCALTWEDNIDLKNKRIIVSGALVPDETEKLVRKDTNKNTSSKRTIPIMIDELYLALKAVDDKTGAVIKQHPNTVWEHINKICAANDLPLVGNHGLRHSFASLAYHVGMPELIAMKIGGWSDYKTMREIYTHLADADIDKYTIKMSNFYNANEKANKKKKSKENQRV